MVRDNRIKTYRFGTLTSNSSGVISTTNSSYPINGEVIKMVVDVHNFAANGSIFCQVRTPFIETIGSLFTTTNTDSVVYFGKVNQAVGTGPPVCDDVLAIVGSGLGDTTSGDIILYYR